MGVMFFNKKKTTPGAEVWRRGGTIHKILLNWYQCLNLNNKSWSLRWFWAKASTTSWPASWRVFETMTSASSWATSMKAGQGWGHKPVAAVGDGILFPLFFRAVFCDAFHKALYGEKIQWLIVGMYEVSRNVLQVAGGGGGLFPLNGMFP